MSDDGGPLGIRPDWWTPEVYRGSVQAIAEMTDCSRCGKAVDDRGGYKFCPKCRTAYSPVVDYEALEAEIIMDALADPPLRPWRPAILSCAW